MNFFKAVTFRVQYMRAHHSWRKDHPYHRHNPLRCLILLEFKTAAATAFSGSPLVCDLVGALVPLGGDSLLVRDGSVYENIDHNLPGYVSWKQWLWRCPPWQKPSNPRGRSGFLYHLWWHIDSIILFISVIDQKFQAWIIEIWFSFCQSFSAALFFGLFSLQLLINP